MINNIALMGRLTFEPELKVTQTGVAVCSFGLAVDRQYQAKGEERKADFIDCQAWRGTAEFICKYFHKGSMLALVGRLQTENYTDKDGNKRKSVTVVADNVSFCGSKAESGANPPIANPPTAGSPIANQSVANPPTAGPPTASQSRQGGATYKTADNTDFEEIVDDDDDLPF